jgi:hypothetical protein
MRLTTGDGFPMDTKTETGLAARVVSDVVEGLENALSGWQEMTARADAEGLDISTEAATVAQAIDKAKGLIFRL